MSINGSAIRSRRLEHNLSQAKLSELCGVPQSLLSAYELGKTGLEASVLKAVEDALADGTQVDGINKREKRYRTHTYTDVARIPERVAKAIPCAGNEQYRQVLDEISALHEQSKERLSALSLFSGCGGFSLGFSAAGFLIKGFLELDSGLREIYKKNFFHSIEVGSDITLVNQEMLQEIFQKVGPVDVIFGGPPCQGFSLSGKRQISDPRNALFRHFLRFVDVFRPKLVLLENVRLLMSMKSITGIGIQAEIRQAFEEHGYQIQAFEFNAKDYGVPQHRERVIFIAVRNDLELRPTFPERTHRAATDLFSDVSRYRTFADACSDLPYLESGERADDPLHEAVKHPAHIIDWLWEVPEGSSAHENPNPRNRPPSGYNTTYKRQVWSEPASTVQTTFGMISGCRNVHPIATRSLTIREAARIQSFPDSYNFVGNRGTIRRGIGNAVPPLLAFQLARHVRDALLNFVEVPSL